MTEVPAQQPGSNSPEPDPWSGLKAFTQARIALGRTGSSVPLRESLAFKLAHAHARDAVYSTLALSELITQLEALGLPVYQVRSSASNRQEYLQRPDWGRQLHPDSRTALQEQQAPTCDVAIVVADGLSAEAVNDHAVPLLQQLVPKLQASGFLVGPITLAEQGRVALGDEIGELLQAQLLLMLIGERPGLSSPNSLGAYFTYAPKRGLTDEARNCISNIRPEGLPYQMAADKMSWLIQESLRRQLSGVQLKDETNLLAE